MHAAGLWTVFSGALAGLPVVLYDDRNEVRSARWCWRTAEREKVGLMTMVGDAYAAPLVEELDRSSYDLSSLYAIGTGGAATNPETSKRTAGDAAAAHDHQRLRVVGDREHGVRPQSARDRTGRPSICATGRLVAVRRLTRFLEPGETEVGWVVRDRPDPAGLLRRCRRHPQDLPGRRGSARGRSRGTAPRWRPTARCACSAATRWWSTPAARRSSSRRSRRCCAHIRASRTRWSSAATVSGGVRRSSRSCSPIRDGVDARVAARRVRRASRAIQGAQGVHLRRHGPPARQRQGRLPLGEKPSGATGVADMTHKRH